MAQLSFELTAEPRNEVGTQEARRLRRLKNAVPGVLYGSGEPATPIALMHNELSKMLNHESVFSHILTLNMGSEKHKVVIKDVLRHPTKPRILHIDFKQIKATEKLLIEVPVHYVGGEECPGVKDGGVVSHLVSEVEIKCLPADLPEFLEVDISHLNLDDTLHLSDIPLPAGVELGVKKLDEEHNLPIVSVHIPKVSKEDLEAEAAEAALAAESAAESGAEAGAESTAGEAEKEAASPEEEAEE